MFTAILSGLGSLLGGPFARAALEAYKSKLASDNDKEKHIAELAIKEMELQQQETGLRAQYRKDLLGRWYEPANLMAYTVAIYFAKLLLWDKVLSLGSTDPLTDWAAATATVIVSFHFGARGLENVMRILRR